MSETLTAAEIEEQIALRKVRFQQVIGDIRMVLKNDLEAFVARETKRAFLGKPAVSEAMEPQRVVALKQRAAELGKQVGSRADAELADVGLWVTATENAQTRDLSAVPAIWDKVVQVEKDLHAFLGEFGLADAEIPAYKPPAYFVGGLYMPGLAEHYWRLTSEMRELVDQRKKLDEALVRERLQAKWDAGA